MYWWLHSDFVFKHKNHLNLTNASTVCLRYQFHQICYLFLSTSWPWSKPTSSFSASKGYFHNPTHSLQPSNGNQHRRLLCNSKGRSRYSMQLFSVCCCLCQGVLMFVCSPVLFALNKCRAPTDDLGLECTNESRWHTNSGFVFHVEHLQH